MDDRWYERFFDGVVVDTWVRATTPEQTRAEVDHATGALGLEPGARVLDVPCGDGRHARELARRGYAVTGVDLSSEFLARARQAAVSEGLDVEWIEADMREVPAEPPFAAAVCLGNSFGYLDHLGNVSFLRAVASALRPGGGLLLELGTAAESILPTLDVRTWMPVGNMLFLVENRYQVAASRLETHYTFVRDGRTESRVSSQQVYTVAELGRMLEAVGLVPVALNASPAGDPYTFGAPSLLVVARKT